MADLAARIAACETPVLLFGRRTCPLSGFAVQLAQRRDIAYEFVDLDDGNSSAFERELIVATKSYETPYAYMSGEYVGGFRELKARLHGA